MRDASGGQACERFLSWRLQNQGCRFAWLIIGHWLKGHMANSVNYEKVNQMLLCQGFNRAPHMIEHYGPIVEDEHEFFCGDCRYRYQSSQVQMGTVH